MTKLSLASVSSLQNETSALAVINNNSNAIELAFENTLSRDGTQPNPMTSVLDMNSNQIVNLPAPNNANSALRLQDLSDFIGHGVISDMPIGGAAGQVLTKRTSANYDADWESTSGKYDPYNFGAKGDGVTDDYTALQACITAAVAAGKTMTLTDGTFNHSLALNWAWNRLKVIAIGANVRFKYTGSGVGHNFSGIANYPGTQGCVAMVFGGPNRIWLEGNASTTDLVDIDNWHFSDMKISARNATGSLVRCQNTGIVGASAVSSTFDIQISPNNDGLSVFPVVSQYGVRANALFVCNFNKLLIEGCGTGTSYPLTLTGCIQNTFTVGSLESNNTGGLSLDSLCKYNTFTGYDFESNGTGRDLLIVGTHNNFSGCACSGTTTGPLISGTNNIFQTCGLTSATNTGVANNYINCRLITSFSDTTNTATVINPGGGVAQSLDSSVTFLLNKDFNTVNGNTLRINSGTALTATTGTGGTVVLSTSPTLVTPALGTPSAVVLTNATGTASGLTAGNTTTNANLTGPITSVGNATSVAAQTGTGSTFVMNTSPVLVTPNLGTPSAGVLTNATGTAAGLTAGNVTTNANLTGVITSSGNATSIASQTGTGTKFVVDTSPTLVTPNIGVAAATSVNKVALTAPATAATLTIANNKTLTANNSLTLAGTDATTLTFQGTDTYVGRATTDTMTNKTFDTAGTGNSFSINGVAATANTGTGSVVRATSPTITTPVITGVTSGAAASAGNVGEFISSTISIGSAVALVNATAKTITSITLTAGDWDVWGSVVANNGGTITDVQGGISLVNNTQPAFESGGFCRWLGSTTAGPGVAVGRLVVNVSTTTTVYIVATMQFTVSAAGYGFIGARRIR